MTKVEWGPTTAKGIASHPHRVFTCSGTIFFSSMVVSRGVTLEADCERNGEDVVLTSVGNAFTCPMFETEKCVVKKK